MPSDESLVKSKSAPNSGTISQGTRNFVRDSDLFVLESCNIDL